MQSEEVDFIQEEHPLGDRGLADLGEAWMLTYSPPTPPSPGLTIGIINSNHIFLSVLDLLLDVLCPHLQLSLPLGPLCCSRDDVVAFMFLHRAEITDTLPIAVALRPLLLPDQVENHFFVQHV